MPPLLPHAPATRAVRFAAELAAYGDAVALLTPTGELTYRELAGRVDGFAARLGPTRRLVLVQGANTPDALVAYLGALAGGHPVLLVPGDNAGTTARLTAAYDPDVVVAGGTVTERRAGTAHDLHPDLALLLSTSGSTGSPKLVRLSHANVQSNAAAIATYLGIRPGDRAVTSLPMHYCYGLSVVNSHLATGAAVVLTDASVVDAEFWELLRRTRATTFAGVPYTFDLLDRVGFAEMDLPDLRYVTQAGGRLDPERVRRYAELGRRRGWDLVVMYGQTEATARMAYLPPDLAAAHPGAIGRPIPGGAFELDPLPGGEDGTGELVYTGPNVMLGYAESPADLALDRTVERLRTGDVARRTAGGLYEIVGRRSRFVKLFGLRVDLDHAEAVLARHGLAACCAGGDDELVVAVAGDAARARRVVTGELGVPASGVRVVAVAELPRLPTGKPDYAAVRALGTAGGPAPERDLRALYARVLDRTGVTEDDSFVSLGGDSLSYVEMSLLLEESLGHLPPRWQTTPIRDLAAVRSTGRRRGRRVETGVLLRAVAVVLIVGTHARLFPLAGTAHLLFAVAGFNFARFQLAAGTRRDRVRAVARSVGRIAVPTVAWIGLASLFSDDYGVENALLLNAVLGPDTWTSQWQLWFVEMLVYVLLGAGALLALPAADRAERRFPFAFPMALFAAGLLTRFRIVDLDLVHHRPVLWLFALGWAAARARTVPRRLLVGAAALATVPGFFGDPSREAIVAGGLLLLLWVPHLRCPAWLARLAGVLAGASLYVYLVQWHVYPELTGVHPLLAVAASIAAGLGYGHLVTRAVPAAVSRVRRRQGHRPVRRTPAAELT